MNATETLKDRYQSYKEANPQVRIRNAAQELGTTEAQLVALGVGENVTKLEGEWTEVLKEIKSLGKVMALTRNDNAVHERKGVYNNVSFNGHVGLVLDPDIDLRLFMMHWASGYAVKEAFRGDFRYSLQFFDKSGSAVHKIYLTADSNLDAYNALVEKYKSANQTTELEVLPVDAPRGEMPDNMIDVAKFQEDWLGLKDTHDFYMMLGKHRVARTQALRLAPEGMAVKIDNKAIRTLLDGAAEQKLPIMVFVGNKGCIQIHTGEIRKTLEHENWYNVMDPDFNLHLNEEGVAQTWLVRKPTTDGIVTAIEVYDGTGEIIVQFFGKRKPGIPEDQNWTKFADSLAL